MNQHFRLLTRAVSKNVRIIPSGHLSSSSKPPKSMITLTDDGTTIVCWHPQDTFPYEHTKPYTEMEVVLASESVLKADTLVAGYNRFFKEGPTLEELQAITYTPKFKWKYNRNDGIQWRPAHPRKGV